MINSIVLLLKFIGYKVIKNNLENFYNILWNSFPQPCFVIDKNLNIIDLNASSETLYMTSKSRLIGRKIDNFVEEGSLLLKVIQQTIIKQAPVLIYDIDIFWAKKDIGKFNVYSAYLEGLNRYILLVMNLNPKKERIDKKLLHQNAARSVSGLSAMLAHEIRNPLAGISGAAQLLAQNANDEDIKFTKLIQSECKRIGNLVSKFEIFGDLGPLVKSNVNIHDVIEKTKELAKAGFASHVRFLEDYDPSLPDIKGNFDQLIQVFLNLLKNSSEAIPENGGFIKIKTSYQSGIKILSVNNRMEDLPISISIIDNGKGISDDLIDKIFDPFVGTKIGGSGLGLSLVSKIIADHGGTIECNSIDNKTFFNLNLPIADKSEKEITDYNIHKRLLTSEDS